MLNTNMAKNVSLNFRFNKIDETKNYLWEEKIHNDLISKKQKKVYKHFKFS